MSAGQISVPIVFRGPNGAAAGVGAQHSQVHCFIPKYDATPLNTFLSLPQTTHLQSFLLETGVQFGIGYYNTVTHYCLYTNAFNVQQSMFHHPSTWHQLANKGIL